MSWHLSLPWCASVTICGHVKRRPSLSCRWCAADLQLSASQRHKHTPERGGVSVRVDDATGTSADATGTAAAVAAGAVAWLGPSSRPSSATLLQSRPRSRRVRNNNSSSNNNNSSSSSNVHHRARGRALGGGVSGGVSGRDMSRSRSEVMMNDPDVRAALLHSALNSATHVHGDGGATVGRRGTLGVGVYGTSLATALSMDSHPDAQRIARQLDAALAPMPNTTSDVGVRRPFGVLRVSCVSCVAVSASASLPLLSRDCCASVLLVFVFVFFLLLFLCLRPHVIQTLTLVAWCMCAMCRRLPPATAGERSSARSMR